MEKMWVTDTSLHMSNSTIQLLLHITGYSSSSLTKCLHSCNYSSYTDWYIHGYALLCSLKFQTKLWWDKHLYIWCNFHDIYCNEFHIVISLSTSIHVIPRWCQMSMECWNTCGSSLSLFRLGPGMATQGKPSLTLSTSASAGQTWFVVDFWCTTCTELGKSVVRTEMRTKEANSKRCTRTNLKWSTMKLITPLPSPANKV